MEGRGRWGDLFRICYIVVRKIQLEPKLAYNTAQKKKFSTKDFFSKKDKIRRELGICLYLLKKS